MHRPRSVHKKVPFLNNAPGQLDNGAFSLFGIQRSNPMAIIPIGISFSEEIAQVYLKHLCSERLITAIDGIIEVKLSFIPLENHDAFVCQKFTPKPSIQ